LRVDGAYRKNSGKGDKTRVHTVIAEFDGVLLAVVMALLVVGLIMVFSSSYYSAIRNDLGMFTYVLSQGRAMLLGIAAMIVMANVPYHLLRKLFWLTPLLYVISLPLLWYTGRYGILANNARRWIYVPVFGSFQTVEFVKLALILFLAFLFDRYKGMLKSWIGIGIGAVFTMIPAFFAWRFTSSLTGGITLAAIGFGMIFIASPYFWRFVGLLTAAAIGMLTFLSTAGGYQARRLESFLDPWADPLGAGFQVIQSMYAVASGGLFGLGLGKSRQKLAHMAEPHNDFIFAIICEELGFAGAIAVIALFGLLIYRGVRIALNADDPFGTLLATGIVVMIATQVIVNIGVVTNTIPNTGVPLPFISYGGSAVLFLLVKIGILLNISRYTKTVRGS